MMGHDQRLRATAPGSSSSARRPARTIGITALPRRRRRRRGARPGGRAAPSGSATSGTTTTSARRSASSGSGSGPGRIDVAPRRYRLVYPTGHPNAESLFVDRQGRLHVITKSFGGGVVYRAPARLSSKRPNRLVAVGAVQEYATDAALTRDGNHVIVRGPALAGVYTVPGFQRVASFALPRAAAGRGDLRRPHGRGAGEQRGQPHRRPRGQPCPWPSPRGSAAPVPTRRRAPRPVRRRARRPARRQPSPTATASPGADASPSPVSGDSSGDGVGALDSPWLMWSIPAVIAVGALGIGLGLQRGGPNES